MYQLQPKSWLTGQEFIKRLSDEAIFPADPANTDYQKYLEWIAAGNQPLPAEEQA